ncbi:MAG: hypothetical protein AAB777_00265, partial [Patescibacteria group bacterium]
MKRRIPIASFEDVIFNSDSGSEDGFFTWYDDGYANNSVIMTLVCNLLMLAITIIFALVCLTIAVSIATSIWWAFIYKTQIAIPVSLALGAIIWLIRECNIYKEQ